MKTHTHIDKYKQPLKMPQGHISVCKLTLNLQLVNIGLPNQTIDIVTLLYNSLGSIKDSVSH